MERLSIASYYKRRIGGKKMKGHSREDMKIKGMYCKYSKTWTYNIDINNINRAVCEMYMDSGANACSKVPKKPVCSIKRFECSGSLCGTS